MILILFIFLLSGCGSGSHAGESPPEMFEFYCRHEAVLCALAIEPHCESEPVIIMGYVTELGMNHAEAYCPELGWVRLIGTRTVAVYNEPGWPMEYQKEYTVGEWLEYVFGWSVR